MQVSVFFNFSSLAVKPSKCVHNTFQESLCILVSNMPYKLLLVSLF